MSAPLSPSIACVLALGLSAGPWAAGSAAQGAATPTARPGSPDTEVRIGHSLLGWRSPAAQPGLAEIALAAGRDGAAVLQVKGGRTAGSVKINLHEGRWPGRLVVELADASSLVSLSVCDPRWCVETSLAAAPQATVRRRQGQRRAPAGPPPAPEVPIELAGQGLVATVPLDWLDADSATLTVHWDRGNP